MEKKGLIILGPQGSGKTTLARSISGLFKNKDVIEISNVNELHSLAPGKKLIILDGVECLIPLSRFRLLYAEKALFHRFILTSNNITKKDIPSDYTTVFNIIELK